MNPLAVWSQHHQNLRHEINQLPEFFLGLAALSDVCHGSYEFQVIRFEPERGAADNAHVLYRTIRHQQPVLKVETVTVFGGGFDNLFDQTPIFRMDSLQYQFQRRFNRGIDFEYAIRFVRPVSLPAQDMPAETSGMT